MASLLVVERLTAALPAVSWRPESRQDAPKLLELRPDVLMPRDLPLEEPAAPGLSVMPRAKVRRHLEQAAAVAAVAAALGPGQRHRR
ncbi:MAG: hypothetical protein ACR2PL_00095 [Dehalococcoidia bacterium]